MANRKRRPAPPAPTNPAATAYAHALEMFAAGRREDAGAALRRTLEFEPRHAGAHNALGILALERDQAAAAEESFARAITLEPGAPEHHSNRGNALQALGRLDEAIACYTRAVELAPERPETHLNLGNALRKQGQTARAQQAYAEVVRLRGDWPTGRLALATTLEMQGRYREATESCRQALRLDPQLVAAWVALGRSLDWLSQNAGAAEAYEQAARLAPQHPELWAQRAESLVRLQRFEEAEQSLRRAIELAPEEPSHQAALGALLERCGRFEEAAASFAVLTRLSPNPAEAWRKAALARMPHGPAGAIEAFEQALALDATDAQTWVNYSGLLYHDGRRDDALAAVLKAQALEPDDENVAYVLSLVQGASDVPVPAGLVTQMFDGMAAGFDQRLVGLLRYCAPERLRQAVDRVLASDAAVLARPWRMIDVGCGTGLCGLAFHDLTRRLTGIDLAQQMLVQAGQRGIYDDLLAGDAVQLLASEESAAELIVAGDMVIYVGDLAPLMSACQRALTPGGMFVFSTERADGEGFTLCGTGRFSHSETFVRQSAADAGFEILLCEDFDLRMERGVPVPGQAYVLQKK